MFNTSLFHDMWKNSIRMSGLLWRENRLIVLVLVALFSIGSTTSFLQSGAMALLINELVEISGSGKIDIRLGLFIAFFIVAMGLPAVLFTVQSYFTNLSRYFLKEKFDLMIIKKTGDLDIALHESPSLKDLLNKIADEGSLRVRYFSDRQFYIFQNVIEVVIASAILLFFKWWLFIIIFAGTLPELIVEARYGRAIWAMHTDRAERRRRYKNLHGHFNVVSNLSELKLFQNIGYFTTMIKELMQGFYREEKQNEKRKLLHTLAALGSSQAVIVIAAIYFIAQVVDGKIMIGTLTFILSSIGALRQSLSGLFSNLGEHYQDSLFITDIFRYLDTKPVIRKPDKGIVLDMDKTPEIVFEKVTFYYPGTKRIILKDFSLVIRSGEKVALVGINGAGKTTIVKLLCRFYDPDAGRITVEGHDLKKIDLESWYSKMGVLFQDYARYNFPVKEAIAMGRSEPEGSMSMVKEAAEASGAAPFIETWEKNYDQMLGRDFSGGIEPSVGQWQKLALARIFYRDPRVLILDEPTSSIDACAEARIFDQMEALPKDRTVVLISHRFSTVRNADKIVVLQEGAIKEVGTHEELLLEDGIYSLFFNLQADGYK